MNYIGISEDRLHHIYGVAKRCYEIAQDEGYDEKFCRRMFMTGWNHDVGYEFAVEQVDHATIGCELLTEMGVSSDKNGSKVKHAIRKHGRHTNIKSAEWVILNKANMTVDSKGNVVTVEERLKDIGQRYGEDSQVYLTAKSISVAVGLLKEQEK